MRSEMLKLRYSRLTWIMCIAILALMAISHAIVIVLPHVLPWLIGMNKVVPNFTDADQMTDAQLALLSFENSAAQWQVAGIIGSSTGLISPVTIGVVLLAALAIASEYRYDSISLTVQLTPQRGRVLLEKLTAVAVLTTLVAVALVVLSTVALLIGTKVGGVPLVIPLADLVLSWLTSWVALLLIGFIGFAVGLIVRSQLFSVAVLLGLAMLESILRPVSTLLFGGPSALSVLPFGLSYDVSARENILTGIASADFEPQSAMIMLLAWAAAVVLIAGVVFLRRDVVGRA